jgi:hypothetical protein
MSALPLRRHCSEPQCMCSVCVIACVCVCFTACAAIVCACGCVRGKRSSVLLLLRRCACACMHICSWTHGDTHQWPLAQTRVMILGGYTHLLATHSGQAEGRRAACGRHMKATPREHLASFGCHSGARHFFAGRAANVPRRMLDESQELFALVRKRIVHVPANVQLCLRILELPFYFADAC